MGERGNVLDDASVRELRQMLAERRRQVRGRPPGKGRTPQIVAPADGIPFYNDSGETIPAFGLMAVTNQKSGEADPYLVCAKPSSTFHPLYAVNGDSEVLYQDSGRCFTHGPVRVLYDGTGSVAYGAPRGPKEDQWTSTHVGDPRGILTIYGNLDSAEHIAFAHLQPRERVLMAKAQIYGTSPVLESTADFPVTNVIPFDGLPWVGDDPLTVVNDKYAIDAGYVGGPTDIHGNYLGAEGKIVYCWDGSAWAWHTLDFPCPAGDTIMGT